MCGDVFNEKIQWKNSVEEIKFLDGSHKLMFKKKVNEHKFHKSKMNGQDFFAIFKILFSWFFTIWVYFFHFNVCSFV